jgi:hypothetical protein
MQALRIRLVVELRKTSVKGLASGDMDFKGAG